MSVKSHPSEPGISEATYVARFTSAVLAIIVKFWSLLLYLLLPPSYLNVEQPEVAPPVEPKVEPQNQLFPLITHEDIKDEDALNAKACSTGLTTRLLPFKNEDGEIEWAFTEDVIPGNELDLFKIKDHDLSPVTSNSSNNELIISKKKDDGSHHQTPISSSSSPDSDDDDENKVHQCPHCDAVFKIRGYLTRHLKKHAAKKAYSCPFHKYSIYIDENNITHKCHPNGGFSRRDTYKTHLKSRHFRYPKGTKTKERATAPGNCSMCGEHFQNSEIWSEIHVEGGECKFLPPGFKGKSRFKNRMRKQLSKRLKEPHINEATVSAAAKAAAMADAAAAAAAAHGASEDFGGSVSSNSSSHDLSLDTPSVSATPLVMQYDYQPHNSPTHSVSSSIQHTPYNPIQQLHHQQQSHINQAMSSQSKLQSVTTFDQFSHAPAPMVYEGDDYDDEYCLDVDQLNYAALNALYMKSLSGDLNYGEFMPQPQPVASGQFNY